MAHAVQTSTFQWLRRGVLIVALGGTISAGFVNCSAPSAPSGNANAASQSVSAALTLSPSTQTINAGTTLQLTAAGGAPPYSYNVTLGGGTVSSTGLFTAPSNPDVTSIAVTDSSGVIAISEITTIGGTSTTVTIPLSITASSVSLQPGQTATFMVSGGTAPYTLSLSSGPGTLANQTFTATTAGNSTITVMDSAGGSASVVVNTIVVCGTVNYAGPESCHGGHNSSCTAYVNFSSVVPTGCQVTAVHANFRYFNSYGSCATADSRDFSNAFAASSGGGTTNGKTASWSGRLDTVGRILMLSSQTGGWGDCGGNPCNACISNVQLTITTAPQ